MQNPDEAIEQYQLAKKDRERERVIAAAKEVGAYRYINRAAKDEPTHTFTVEQLERFYTISFEAGRQAEREEIVKDLLPPITTPQTKAHYIANEIAEALCKAIRARGDSK